MKVSADKFASQIGISRRALIYKEDGEKPWMLSELIAISEIMKQNGINEHLTVSQNGDLFDICITKIVPE